jgi:hypothetical protein
MTKENLKSVALKAAEKSSIQIFSNKIRQRRLIDGKNRSNPNRFSLSTYEIWKALVSFADFFLIANFHVLGLFIPKKRVSSEKKNLSVTRRCRGFSDEI